jgi:hypothetical protein
MMYNLKDLKRNERGIKYEKEEKKLELIDHSDIRQYSDKKMDHYEWELKIQKDCGFCHDHREDPKPDKEDKEHGGGTKENLDDDSWQNIAKGDTSDYDMVNETNDTTYSDHITDSDNVIDTGNDSDQKNDGDNNNDDEDANGQTKMPDDKIEEKDDIPPVPYKPPVPLPTEDETPPPPPPRPRVVPPMNENPVLMSKKLVTDNSRATKTLFKMPKEEEHYYSPIVPFEKRKFRYLVQPEEEFEFQIPQEKQDNSQTPKSNSSRETIESIIRKINSQKIGYKMSSSDLIEKFPELSTAKLILKNLEKVNGGIKVNFTFAGKLLKEIVPNLSIADGAVFKIKDVIINQDKSSALHVENSHSKLYNTPLSVYIRGNLFSRFGKEWFPIIKK